MAEHYIVTQIRNMKFLFTILIGAAFAFTPYQMSIIRTQQSVHMAPPRSAIVDGILAQDYAFTDQVKTLSHIDGVRFECCPNTFTNVVTHEIHHQNGRQHTSGVKNDPMSYLLTVRASGEIVEDNFVLPALSANQPWAAQILSRNAAGGNSGAAGIATRIRRLPVQVLTERLTNSTATAFGQP